jgi:hypothetical protein
MLTMVRRWASLMGVDIQRVWSWRYLPRFASDWASYRRRWSGPRFPLTVRNAHPILIDYSEHAGSAAGHYFHQDLWAARKVFEQRPSRHVDIGSRIDGFVAHVLPFMPVTVVDIRPLASSIQGLEFVQSDATTLSTFPDASVPSLSCLHAAEHFGLGRYGDPVEPSACFTVMAALSRVLAASGSLYFSVPIGRERLEFNAQRVFNPLTILEAFADLRLVSFSAVNDAGDLEHDADPERFLGATYACGLFEFTKDPAAGLR